MKVILFRFSYEYIQVKHAWWNLNNSRHITKTTNSSRIRQPWNTNWRLSNLWCYCHCSCIHYNFLYSDTSCNWKVWKLISPTNFGSPWYSISTNKQHKVLTITPLSSITFNKKYRRKWSWNRMNNISPLINSYCP